MATATSTGARVVFKMNGTEVLFANAMNYTVAHAHQPADILGQPEPAEYAETGYTVNFTATKFRVNTRGAVAQGLRPRLEDLMRQPELSASMVDKVSNKTLFTISRVKCTQEDFNVDARNLSQTVLSFVGIKMSEADSPAGENRDAEEKTTGVARDI